MPVPIHRKVARLLKAQQWTIATAESCTGGLLAHRLTNIPGSSSYFKAGLVTYSNESKNRLLKVSLSLLRRHGAVSRPVTRQMAQQIRRLNKTEVGIGISGIAGPGGGTATKPVGLTYIAVCAGPRCRCERFTFTGSRLSIKRQAATQALMILEEMISSERCPDAPVYCRRP